MLRSRSLAAALVLLAPALAACNGGGGGAFAPFVFPAGAPIEMVSVSPTAGPGDADAEDPAISADGRFVAFYSIATNLVSGTADTNGELDVFLRDRLVTRTALVSVSPTAGLAENGGSFSPSLSADGRLIAFSSEATNLVAGDMNGKADIFLHDRLTGATTLVSVSPTGEIALGGASLSPSISADGRIVAFDSEAKNLVAGDTNNLEEIFVRDLAAGATELVSVSLTGGSANNNSYQASISADGRFVAFTSDALDLVAGDTNTASDVFLYDRLAAATTLVSVSLTGGVADGTSGSDTASVSADGRFVAFSSRATNLVAGDTNGSDDIFVRDTVLGTTELVSVSLTVVPAGASISPSISADGRFVAFGSSSSQLVAGDTNGQTDVFVRDRQAGTTIRVNVTSTGAQALDGGSELPRISANGRYVAFRSDATDLVPGDNNRKRDVFVAPNPLAP